jgi:hypothetical protein
MSYTFIYFPTLSTLWAKIISLFWVNFIQFMTNSVLLQGGRVVIHIPELPIFLQLVIKSILFFKIYICFSPFAGSIRFYTIFTLSEKIKGIM